VCTDLIRPGTPFGSIQRHAENTSLSQVNLCLSSTTLVRILVGSKNVNVSELFDEAGVYQSVEAETVRYLYKCIYPHI